MGVSADRRGLQPDLGERDQCTGSISDLSFQVNASRTSNEQ